MKLISDEEMFNKDNLQRQVDKIKSRSSWAIYVIQEEVKRVAQAQLDADLKDHILETDRVVQAERERTAQLVDSEFNSLIDTLAPKGTEEALRQNAEELVAKIREGIY